MPYTDDDHDRELTRLAEDIASAGRTYPITYTNGTVSTVQAYRLYDAYTRAQLQAPEGANVAVVGNPY